MSFLKTKTIRNKILIVFSAVFFVLLIGLFLVNRLFLVDHFIQSNHRNMRKEARLFIEEYRTGNVKDAADALMKNTGARLYLYTKDLQSARFTAGRQEEPDFMASSGEAIYKNAMSPSGHFALLGGDDPQDQFLLYAIVFGDGMLLVLTKAMGVVAEASGLFYRFMLLTSGIVYLVGFVMIYFISGSLSRPIKDMKRITRKMANLEFDEKLTVKGSDEISELTSSVNQMADSLSGTIKDLHQSNERLEKELSKERSLEKMRRRFVSDVSHELKNPISVILGYADGLLQNVPKTAASKKEYYTIIADEAGSMNELVKNLLDLSSYESGAITLDKETFDLNDLYLSAVERFSYITNEKNIQVEYQPHGPCELTADRLRINQVIVNLLGNAFKYVNDGGTIRIDLEQPHGRTRMTISNTGPLIPKKDLRMIFNSFYQTDTQHSGHGLGLAIVKSIVRLHRGSCRAYIQEPFNCFEVIL